MSKIYSDSFGVPKVLGLMGGHVDDFHRIGHPQSQEWAEIGQRIDKLYDWGMLKRGTYRHAGTDVHAFKGNKGRTEITLSQQYYIETVPDLDIPPDRLRQENALMTADEIGACRATWGNLQWLALQTQPQLSARCNLLASEITTKKHMAVARELQQMVGEIRKVSHQLHFRCPDEVESWRDVVFITFCDQAHANRANLDSTGGLLSTASGPAASKGKVTYMAPLAWRSWKLRRKSISSNDAEVQAILEGEDQNFRIRGLWSKMNGAGSVLTKQDGYVTWHELWSKTSKGSCAPTSRAAVMQSSTTRARCLA